MRISDWSSDVCSSDLRSLDTRGQQILERREQDVLEVDGQRQHPVEEGGDRRQFVLETIAVAERQSCRRLESPELTALDLAAVEQPVKLAQGVERRQGFQIVPRSERALGSGLGQA